MPGLLPLMQMERFRNRWQAYIFFSEHVLVAASHIPPAFLQSASVFAAVTSPAKAGAVNANARARASTEIRLFMGVSPFYAGLQSREWEHPILSHWECAKVVTCREGTGVGSSR